MPCLYQLDGLNVVTAQVGFFDSRHWSAGAVYVGRWPNVKSSLGQIEVPRMAISIIASFYWSVPPPLLKIGRAGAFNRESAI